MSLKTTFTSLQRLQRGFSSVHRNYNVTRVVYNKSTRTEDSSSIHSGQSIASVPGLSDKVISENCEGPVGPGASKSSDYKNPEYFCYNVMSYYEAEIEMAKYRCPQPSNKKSN